MILGFLTKYRDYRARVHTGPGGDTSTSYIMMFHIFPPKRLWDIETGVLMDFSCLRTQLLLDVEVRQSTSMPY